MSIDLRRAAYLMRARANAVGEGPWESYPLPDAGPNRWTMTGIGVAGDEMGHRTETMFRPDAEHIASWHPSVALAVADLLDAEFDHPWGPSAEAITVAEVYLAAHSSTSDPSG